MADVHPLAARVVHELWVFLIYSVVGQVDILLPQIILVGRDVGLGGEPGQPLLVNVDPHGAYPAQQNVDSEIELESFDQQRFRDILLHYIMLSVLHLLHFLRQKNTPSLAVSLRLYDKCLLLTVELFPKLTVLAWK